MNKVRVTVWIQETLGRWTPNDFESFTDAEYFLSEGVYNGPIRVTTDLHIGLSRRS